MQCPVCIGRFGRALNLLQEVVSRASPHLSSCPNTHPLDAVGAEVVPVTALDTAGFCVPRSCTSQGMSAHATTPCACVCTSHAVTWACQYWGHPHPQRAPRVPALCCSPQRLLWAAGDPPAGCPNLPQILDGLMCWVCVWGGCVAGKGLQGWLL